MPISFRLTAIALVLASPALSASPAWAQDFKALETIQGAANAAPGPRSAPARVFPVPQDVSPAAQALVGAPW